MHKVRFTIDKHTHIAVYPLSPSICTSFPFFFFFVCVHVQRLILDGFSLTFSTFEKYYISLITPKLGGVAYVCACGCQRQRLGISALLSLCGFRGSD